MDPSESIHFICSLKLLKFNGMENMNNFDVCWNDNLFNVSIQKFSKKKCFEQFHGKVFIFSVSIKIQFLGQKGIVIKKNIK